MGRHLGAGLKRLRLIVIAKLIGTRMRISATQKFQKRYKKNCCPTTRLKSRKNPRNLHILRKIPTLRTTGKNCLMMPLQNDHFMEFKHFYIFAEFYIYKLNAVSFPHPTSALHCQMYAEL